MTGGAVAAVLEQMFGQVFRALTLQCAALARGFQMPRGPKRGACWRGCAGSARLFGKHLFRADDTVAFHRDRGRAAREIAPILPKIRAAWPRLRRPLFAAARGGR